MTNEEIVTLRDNAIEKYEYLSTICPADTEFVFVVTRDVYETLQRHVQEFPLEFRNGEGLIAMFYGNPVCIVNEDTENSMFTPAVRGCVYYPGMHLDDIILVEDNHLYSLRSTEPAVTYVDTGLTVSFGNEWQVTGWMATENVQDMITRVTADVVSTGTLETATVNGTIEYTPDIGNITAAIDRFGYGVDTATDRLHDLINGLIRNQELTFTVDNVQINQDLFTQEYTPTYLGVDLARPVSTRERRSAKEMKNREEELKPGDTKELDSFLESFMRNGA